MLFRSEALIPTNISTKSEPDSEKKMVIKRGEIIPKIEALAENPPNVKEIEYPDTCSVCGTPLTNEGTRLYCPNMSCPKLIHHRIEKWISVLDIRDFGITLIKRLFDMGRVNSITSKTRVKSHCLPLARRL